MRFAFTLLSALVFSFCYAQNVGIGITTPAVPLHIKNNGSELLRLQSNDPQLTFYNNSGVVKGFVQGLGENLNLGTAIGNSTGLIQFYNNGNLNMVIDPNSNVGIGGPATDYKLAINSTVVQGNNNTHLLSLKGRNPVLAFVNEDNSAFGYIKVWNNAPFAPFTNGLVIGSNPGYPIFFSTNNYGATMTVTDNGNVGIGTTNPLGRLHINSGGNALTLSGNSPYIYYLDAGGIAKGFLWNNGGNNMDLGTEVGNNSGEVKLTIRGIDGLTVQSDSRVRVGAGVSNFSLPVGGLDKPNFTVNGALAIKMLSNPLDEWAIAATLGFTGTGALSFFKNGASRAFIDDNGNWNNFSDASLKENIKLFRSVLSQITKLQVSTYQLKWNSRSDHSFGLIAQNVNEYFPEIVSENIDKDGKRLLAICYAKTGVLAIKAIQEQQDIIETQRKRIDEQHEINETQQKKIDELEKRLSKLEKKLK